MYKNLIAALLVLTTISFTACNGKKEKSEEFETYKETKNIANEATGPAVYNYADSSEFQEFLALDLDANHPNLLNPTVAKDSMEHIVKVWTKLHQDIGAELAKMDFTWDSNDEAIKVFHKIYFKPNGQIKHHFYNILSDSISKENKVAFGRALKNIGKDYSVDIARASPFAQCGKVSYPNN